MGLFLLNKNLFIKYELNEDAHTKDQAWKDIAGAMIGFVLGRTLLIGIVIYFLVRWII